MATRMSAENVAIVKSSWAGWRQALRDQMLRDLADGIGERIDEWAEQAGGPKLQPLEFIDGGDKVLVCASVVGEGQILWFNYTLDGPRVVGWDVYEEEAKARKAAGI
jgi:hypothetical protein